MLKALSRLEPRCTGADRATLRIQRYGATGASVRSNVVAGAGDGGVLSIWLGVVGGLRSLPVRVVRSPRRRGTPESTTSTLICREGDRLDQRKPPILKSKLGGACFGVPKILHQESWHRYPDTI